MIIYKTTNTINGMIYIGQDSNNNPNYYGSGIIIKNVIRKYGKKALVKEILCECNSFEELDKMEIYYIEQYDSSNPNIGYNITKGGSGLTKEKIEKLTKQSYGRKHSEETRKKLSIINSGPNHKNWGIKRPDHIKIKNSKPVIVTNRDTNESIEFISIRDAAKYLKVNSGNVMRVLKKQRPSCKNHYINYKL